MEEEPLTLGLALGGGAFRGTAHLGVLKALEENAACSIFLKKTNIKTLEIIKLEDLKKYAIDIS